MGKVVALAVGALAAAVGTWFLGMRNGWRPVVDLQRRINRDALNPRQLARIGQPGGPTAVVHHTGRRSGKPYATPVDAAVTEDGFVIASVYGTQSDWIRNVLAGGPTSVEMAGVSKAVGSARVVPIEEVQGYFPPADQRGHRIFGVHEALRLSVVG